MFEQDKLSTCWLYVGSPYGPWDSMCFRMLGILRMTQDCGVQMSFWTLISFQSSRIINIRGALRGTSCLTSCLMLSPRTTFWRHFGMVLSQPIFSQSQTHSGEALRAGQNSSLSCDPSLDVACMATIYLELVDFVGLLWGLGPHPPSMVSMFECHCFWETSLLFYSFFPLFLFFLFKN